MKHQNLKSYQLIRALMLYNYIYQIYKLSSEAKEEQLNENIDLAANQENSLGGSSENLETLTREEPIENENYTISRPDFCENSRRTDRFVSEDPIGLNGGNNMYKFTKNNPIKWNDPFGLICIINEKFTSVLLVGLFDAFVGGEILAREAIQLTDLTGLPGSGSGGKGDAFKHCYWSCLMTKILDAKTALKIGIIHEDCNKKNKCRDREMDLHNNLVGIHIGEHFGDAYNAEDCALGCMGSLFTGLLDVIEK